MILRRTTFLYSLFSFLAISACKFTSEKDNAELKQYAIEDFMDSKSFVGAAFSSDGNKILFSSNETGLFNVFSYDLNSNKSTQLTNSDINPMLAISYLPNSENVLISSDADGNENFHIYLHYQNGNILDLTPNKNSRTMFLNWSADNKFFYYKSNARDSRFFDLYAFDVALMKPTLLYQNNDGYRIEKYNEQLNLVILNRTLTTSSNQLFAYNIKSKTVIPISLGEDIQGSYDFCDFNTDSNSLYFLSNANSEFKQLYSINLNSTVVTLVEGNNYDHIFCYFSTTKKYLVNGYNRDGCTKVTITNNQTGDVFRLNPPGDGYDVSTPIFSLDDEKMAFYQTSGTSPKNLYVLNLTTKERMMVTRSLSEKINPDDLVASVLVKFKAKDGLEIPAFLYPSKSKTKSPAIVYVHGGPGGQFRATYDPLIQYLVSHNYTVIAVNNRGSAGYGKGYYRLDDKKHGHDNLSDLVAAKNYLATLENVDTSKIAILGGSYGGFLALTAMTHHPGEFKSAVSIFGIVNWMYTLNAIPTWWESYRNALYEEMGDPKSADSLQLAAISPINNVANIQHPIMLIHGVKDDRVQTKDIEIISSKLKAEGRKVELILLDNESHGFKRKENEMKSYQSILSFLNSNLAGE